MPPRKRAPAKPKITTQKVAAFDEFRKRAEGFGLNTRRRDPITFAEFTPPIVATFPAKLSQQVELDLAARRADTFGMLAILLGPEQLVRVAQVFEQFEDGDQLIAGFALRVAEHMFGPGAGDVPGGSPAS